MAGNLVDGCTCTVDVLEGKEFVYIKCVLWLTALLEYLNLATCLDVAAYINFCRATQF